jgi:hypothetical protein
MKIEIFKRLFFNRKKMNKKGLEDSLFTWLIVILIIFFFTIIYITIMVLNFPEQSDAIVFDPPKNKEINSALFYYHANNLLEKRIIVDGESIKSIDAIKKSLDPYFEVKNEDGISFANKQFSRYYYQEGLKLIELGTQLKDTMILNEGFNEEDYNDISQQIFDLQKSDAVRGLSDSLGKFCSENLLLLPYGVIHQGILKTGPKPRGASSDPPNVWSQHDPTNKFYVEFVKDVNYRNVNFQIKLRMSKYFLNNMNKKLH